MNNGLDFKEATLIVGRLLRISNRKAEIEFEDSDTGEPTLHKVRLAEDVEFDIDTIGKDVKIILVDGRVARISRIYRTSSGSRETPTPND